MKKRLFVLLAAAMLLFASPAMAAEDVFTITDLARAHAGASDEGYVASRLTSDRSYLRLDVSISGESQVNVSVTDEGGSLVYQRDYGLCSGHFRSEDLYLRLQSNPTTYRVSVRIGENAYAFPLRRVMPRLRGQDACSVGYPLAALSGGSSWKTVTLLDLAALEGSGKTVALHAGGAYNLGSVTFSVSGGKLRVTANLHSDADGSIDSGKVYVATSALEARSLGKKGFSGVTGALNESIALGGASYAAVYVKLTVSFDPAGVSSGPDTILPGQDSLWNTMQTVTANEAVG